MCLYAIGVGGWAMVYFFATDSPRWIRDRERFVESVNADGSTCTQRRSVAPSSAARTLLFAVGLWRSGPAEWIVVLAVVGSVVTFLP